MTPPALAVTVSPRHRVTHIAACGRSPTAAAPCRRRCPAGRRRSSPCRRRRRAAGRARSRPCRASGPGWRGSPPRCSNASRAARRGGTRRAGPPAASRSPVHARHMVHWSSRCISLSCLYKAVLSYTEHTFSSPTSVTTMAQDSQHNPQTPNNVQQCPATLTDWRHLVNCYEELNYKYYKDKPFEGRQVHCQHYLHYSWLLPLPTFAHHRNHGPSRQHADRSRDPCLMDKSFVINRLKVKTKAKCT